MRLLHPLGLWLLPRLVKRLGLGLGLLERARCCSCLRRGREHWGKFVLYPVYSVSPLGVV